MREETEVKSGKCTTPVLWMLLQDRSGLDKNIKVYTTLLCPLDNERIFSLTQVQVVCCHFVNRQKINVCLSRITHTVYEMRFLQILESWKVSESSSLNRSQTDDVLQRATGGNRRPKNTHHSLVRII